MKTLGRSEKIPKLILTLFIEETAALSRFSLIKIFVFDLLKLKKNFFRFLKAKFEIIVIFAANLFKFVLKN